MFNFSHFTGETGSDEGKIVYLVVITQIYNRQINYHLEKKTYVLPFNKKITSLQASAQTS